jgi:hypothetical protein
VEEKKNALAEEQKIKNCGSKTKSNLPMAAALAAPKAGERIFMPRTKEGSGPNEGGAGGKPMDSLFSYMLKHIGKEMDAQTDASADLADACREGYDASKGKAVEEIILDGRSQNAKESGYCDHDHHQSAGHHTHKHEDAAEEIGICEHHQEHPHPTLATMAGRCHHASERVDSPSEDIRNCSSTSTANNLFLNTSNSRLPDDLPPLPSMIRGVGAGAGVGANGQILKVRVSVRFIHFCFLLVYLFCLFLFYFVVFVVVYVYISFFFVYFCLLFVFIFLCCLLFLFCFILFYFVDVVVVLCCVMFCFALLCFVLFCVVLFCFVLFCFVLLCFVLFCFYFILLCLF